MEGAIHVANCTRAPCTLCGVSAPPRLTVSFGEGSPSLKGRGCVKTQAWRRGPEGGQLPSPRARGLLSMSEGDRETYAAMALIRGWTPRIWIALFRL